MITDATNATLSASQLLITHTSSLNQEIALPDLLFKWLNEGNENEKRSKAAARIEACWRERSDRLDLQGLGLVTLPAEIWPYLTHLGDLDLDDNHFSSVPEGLVHLTSLDTLYLAGNQLETLPKWFGQLNQLEFLDISENYFNTLPEILSQLQNLAILRCSINDFHTFPPVIVQLTQLEELDINLNRLSKLPSQVGQLSQLTYLNLADNHLTTLPHQFNQLQNLEKLILDGNAFGMVPSSILQLTNLGVVSFKDNQLMEFPLELTDLPALYKFNLAENYLYTDSEDFEDFDIDPSLFDNVNGFQHDADEEGVYRFLSQNHIIDQQGRAIGFEEVITATTHTIFPYYHRQDIGELQGTLVGEKSFWLTSIDLDEGYDYIEIGTAIIKMLIKDSGKKIYIKLPTEGATLTDEASGLYQFLVANKLAQWVNK
jgi:hypothetical protein